MYSNLSHQYKLVYLMQKQTQSNDVAVHFIFVFRWSVDFLV